MHKLATIVHMHILYMLIPLSCLERVELLKSKYHETCECWLRTKFITWDKVLQDTRSQTLICLIAFASFLSFDTFVYFNFFAVENFQ